MDESAIYFTEGYGKVFDCGFDWTEFACVNSSNQRKRLSAQPFPALLINLSAS